jgi:hypothetical protein
VRHLQIYRDKTDAPLAPPPSPLNAVRSVGAAGDGRGEINYLGHPNRENQRFSGAGGTGGNLRRNSGGVLTSIKYSGSQVRD